MVQCILAHTTPLALEILVLQPFLLVVNRERLVQLSDCLESLHELGYTSVLSLSNQSWAVQNHKQ